MGVRVGEWMEGWAGGRVDEEGEQGRGGEGGDGKRKRGRGGRWGLAVPMPSR